MARFNPRPNSDILQRKEAGQRRKAGQARKGWADSVLEGLELMLLVGPIVLGLLGVLLKLFCLLRSKRSKQTLLVK